MRGLDDETLDLVTLADADGDPDERESAKAGDLRLRRTIVYRLGDGPAQRRSYVLTDREKIFAVNSLYEKWVRGVFCVFCLP